MEFVVGGADMADYVPLLEEELALLGEDRRGPAGARPTSRPTREFRVAIIGAGMSGLLAAHRLQQPPASTFVVLEKNADVGGTWYENSYPGCRVDNPNHNYSYSFAQRHDWPLHFSTQDVLLDYFRRCADDFGVRERIRFGTEVLSATWSDGGRTLDRPSSATADGDEETIEANAVISAVGQLNRPSFPPSTGASPSRARRSTRRGGTTTLDLSRQAGRGDRHRRERGAVRARDRRVGRPARRVPAHAAVDGSDTRVPRARARRAALALRARAVVQRVESLLDLLEDGRRRAARRAGRSRVGRRRTAR